MCTVFFGGGKCALILKCCLCVQFSLAHVFLPLSRNLYEGAIRGLDIPQSPSITLVFHDQRATVSSGSHHGSIAASVCVCVCCSTL